MFIFIRRNSQSQLCLVSLEYTQAIRKLSRSKDTGNINILLVKASRLPSGVEWQKKMRTNSRVLRTWSRRWRKGTQSETWDEEREERQKECACVCVCETRDVNQIMKIRTSGRRCRLKARCDAAGTCNNVTFISLIRVGRCHPPTHGGGLRRYYLISNVIAYLITLTICIHRRVVGRESFLRAPRERHMTAFVCVCVYMLKSLPWLFIFHHNYT